MRRDMYEEIFEMLKYCGNKHKSPRQPIEQQACMEWITKYAALWRSKKEAALRPV